jgi:hypothetical protein
MCYFRYLGGHEQTSFLDADNFDRLQMAADWHTWVDRHGQGFAVEFPVKLQKIVRSSPQSYITNEDGILEKAPRIVCEWVAMDFLKNVHSLDHN